MLKCGDLTDFFFAVSDICSNFIYSRSQITVYFYVYILCQSLNYINRF